MLTVTQTSSAAEVDDNYFPLRNIYSTVPTISHRNLLKNINDLLIIDVRSAYEYKVLHLSNAVNIPITNLGFMPALKQLRSIDKRTIVFYCNGIACHKSYKASLTANKYGIDKVLTFDLGIMNWALLYPQHSVFFGESPLKAKQLITDDQLNQHIIPPKQFIQKMTPDTWVIDIREPFQRENVILAEQSISIPINKFHHKVLALKQSQSPILIFDAVGKQIRWLQYLLEKHGIDDYYFMEGGVNNYLAQQLGK